MLILSNVLIIVVAVLVALFLTITLRDASAAMRKRSHHKEQLLLLQEHKRRLKARRMEGLVFNSVEGNARPPRGESSLHEAYGSREGEKGGEL